jgi:uncharacterized membrane protein
MNIDSKKLLHAESEQLIKLQKIVKKTIEDENLIIENLLNPPKDILTNGQEISDKVARFGGSWSFIISFFIILISWIVYNSLSSAANTFDPFPFILMNLILSCIAALQAPIIMMSQNRQEEKDRSRAKKDYMINLKAELEIRMLHEKIDHLILHQQQDLLEIQNIQVDMLKDVLNKFEKNTGK